MKRETINAGRIKRYRTSNIYNRVIDSGALVVFFNENYPSKFIYCNSQKYMHVYILYTYLYMINSFRKLRQINFDEYRYILIYD